MAEAKKTASKKKSAKKNTELANKNRINQEITAIVMVAIGVFLAFGLIFDSAGRLGGALNTIFSGCFGKMAFVFPFFLIIYGLVILFGKGRAWSLRPMIFTILIFILLTMLFASPYINPDGSFADGATFSQVFDASVARESGGIVGMYLAKVIISLIGKAGLYILAIALIIISAIIIINTPMSKYAGVVKQKHLSAREERLQRRAEREAQLALEDDEDDREYDYGDDVAPQSNTDDTEEKASLFVPSFLKPKGKSKKENILETVKSDDTYGLDSDRENQVNVESTGLGLEPEGTTIGFGLEPVDRGNRIGMGLEPTGYAPDNFDGPNEIEISGAAEDTDKFTMSDLDKEIKPVEKAPRVNTYDPREDLPPTNKPKPAPKTTSMQFESSCDDSNYRLPTIDLLSRGKGKAKVESQTELKRNAAKLEQALRDFKVEARVAKVTVGPTVTRYEVEPDVGVKIQSIRSLEPDLALKLEVRSVRVVPMPGQSVIGIEAYNANTNVVTLREIIESPEFMEDGSKTSFVLGKNISGKKIIADLRDMPHLLIAGTTGSGKSVCINSILVSLIYKAKPSELKLILIDPKVVELKSYNDIPHLILPVVTDPERASMALGYAVTMMNDRYKKFSEHNVRNLDGYNAKMKKDGTLDEVLPQIVIVIDELSDLMMVASGKVQEYISRLAAMARAAGMHLIVATQQPLASILTSVIKANIPSRIAFSVSSNSASRVILDNPGAERLHGNGDMLFSPVGTREPMRIQGSFVSDPEVHKVTEYVKKQMNPDYNNEVLEEVVTGPPAKLVDEEDDLFRSVVEMVLHLKTKPKVVSVSMIQRKFRVGYNKAARFVDMMEELGMVASSDGSNKPRTVTWTDEQFANYLGVPTQESFLEEEPANDFDEEDYADD